MKKTLIITIILAIFSLTMFACGESETYEYQLNYTTLEMDAGENFTLELNYGSEIIDSNINWASSNFTIVEVSGGVLTAYKGGSVIITATYLGVDYKCEVTVNEELEYSLNYTEFELPLNQSFTLELYENDREVSSGIIWTSSNPTIASVSGGVVSAKSLGTATITATYDAIKYTCDITVFSDFSVDFTTQLQQKEFAAGDITTNYNVMYLDSGDTLQLEWFVKTELDSDSDEVEFFSTMQDVASVSQSGLLEAKSGGMTVIKVESKQTKLQLDGQYASYSDEFILFVGESNDTAKQAFATDKKYASSFVWQGFSSELYGADTAENSSWNVENLIIFNADISISVQNDFTFVQEAYNLPQNGYIETIDYSLSETTIAEAKAKYGNAYLNADLAYVSYSGEILFYGDKAYLLAVLQDSYGVLSFTLTTFDEIGFVPLCQYDVYENLIYDLNSFDLSGESDAVYEYANIYQSSDGGDEMFLLNLKSDGTFEISSVDKQDDIQIFVASGIYKENETIDLYYYKNAQRYCISLQKLDNTLFSSQFADILSQQEVTFNIINLVGVYQAVVKVEQMGIEFNFDLTIKADGTYIYYRQYSSLIDESVVTSGNYTVKDGILILENDLNKTITFNIIGNSMLVSIGSIYTGGMDSSLVFERV